MGFVLRRVRAIRPVPIIDDDGAVLPRDDVLYLREAPTGSTAAGFANLAAGDEVFEFDLVPESGNDADLEPTKIKLEVRSLDDSVLFTGSAVSSDRAALTITARLVGKAPVFRRIGNAELRWHLRTGEEWQVLDASGMDFEFYFMSLRDNPLQMRWKGVPISLLREVTDIQDRLSESTSNGLDDLGTNEIVSQIFNANPPRYEIVWGAPGFTSLSGSPGNFEVTLDYQRYVAAKNDPNSNTTLNCYDTASLVQYLMQFISEGYIEWLYMTPFGYLKQTDLIGRGQCNNPFYGNSRFLNKPVVDPTAHGRSAFGNHAFCYTYQSGRILDACAGPHQGTETEQQYVDAAIDTQTPIPPAIQHGTVADITVNPGVTKVNATVSTKVDMAAPAVGEFADVTGFDWTAPSAPAGVRPLRSPLEYLLGRESGWALADESLSPGHPEAKRHWHLTRGASSLSVSIYVSSEGAEPARHRFLSIGSTHQMTITPYVRGPVELGEFSAAGEGGEATRYFWVHGNTVVDIVGHRAAEDALGLARWIQEMIASPAALVPLDQVTPSGIDVSATAVRVGDKIVISAAGGDGFAVDIDGGHAGLRYAAQAPGSITLVADLPSTSAFDVVIVNRETLSSERHAVEIVVTGP